MPKNASILVLVGQVDPNIRKKKQALYHRLSDAGLKLHFVSFLPKEHPDTEILRTYASSIDFEDSRNSSGGLVGSIKKLLTGQSTSNSVDQFVPESPEKIAEAYYDKWHPRAVLCETLFFSKLLEHFPTHVPTFMYGHEAINEDLALDERKSALKRASYVIARSLHEKEMISRITNSEVLLVGELIDETPIQPKDSKIVGIYSPMEEGQAAALVEYCSSFIEPSLEEFKDFRFRVTGPLPDGISELVRAKIDVVDTTFGAQFLEDVMVMINPYDSTHIVTEKILLSLACARGVLCTSAGARGVRGASGTGVFIADNEAQFKSSLSRLISTEAGLRRVSQSAFQFLHAYNQGTVTSLIRAMTR